MLVATAGLCHTFGSFSLARPWTVELAPSPRRLGAREQKESTLTNMPKLRSWLNGRCCRDKVKDWGVSTMYSPTYNFLFIRNAGKTGGTTVANWVLTSLCSLLDARAVNGTDHLFGGAIVKKGCIEHLMKQGHLVTRGHKTKQSFEELVGNMTVIFSVIRNPCDRASSSYYYCIGEDHRENYTFADFINNPLRSQHLSKSKVRRTLFHYMPQTEQALSENRPCGDGVHLVRLESLSEGMQEVIQHINRQLRPGIPPLPPFPTHAHSNVNKHKTIEMEKCPGYTSCKANMWYSPFRQDMHLLDYETCGADGGL